MTLAELTDAMVRALLNPPGCSEGDFQAARKARLVSSGWPASGERFVSRILGLPLLAEAQHIADGLRRNEAEALAAAASDSDGEVWLDPTVIAPGQLYRYAGRSRGSASLYRIAPAGRLVLALWERNR